MGVLVSRVPVCYPLAIALAGIVTGAVTSRILGKAGPGMGPRPGLERPAVTAGPPDTKMKA